MWTGETSGVRLNNNSVDSQYSFIHDVAVHVLFLLSLSQLQMSNVASVLRKVQRRICISIQLKINLICS